MKNYNFLQHALAISQCATELGLAAQMDFKTFQLTVVWRDKTLTLYPQFSVNNDGRVMYMDRPSANARFFAGWRPYSPKMFGGDKVVMKEYLKSYGIRTPDFSYDVNAKMSDVLVKRKKSSFGVGICGPFKSSSDRSLDLDQGEYYEGFIEGRIAKVWYWNVTPVVAEIVEPLSVTGNGHSTIWELLRSSATVLGRELPDSNYFSEYMSFQGLSLDTVPDVNERCVVDYRYRSVMTNMYRGKDIQIYGESSHGLDTMIEDIGRFVWEYIPSESRQNTVYCVDGIIDAQDNLWVLEVNSNPMVHPFVYRLMLETWVQEVSGEMANVVEVADELMTP